MLYVDKEGRRKIYTPSKFLEITGERRRKVIEIKVRSERIIIEGD